MCWVAGGGVGGGSWDGALHHKKVLPILGILSTSATYYLSPLLSFKFVFWLGTHGRDTAQVAQ